jgi:hypothetical protein
MSDDDADVTRAHAEMLAQSLYVAAVKAHAEAAAQVCEREAEIAALLVAVDDSLRNEAAWFARVSRASRYLARLRDG